MKYPRTPHLPQSPGGTRDDRRLADLSSFVGRPLVVTEKLDGSNVCLEAGGCFARSHGHAPAHPSFDALKALHAALRHRIPDGLQIFGEWLFARHSLHYTCLPSYLLIFGARDLKTLRWASWAEVGLWAEELQVPTVPEIASFEAANDRDLDARLDAIAGADPVSRYGGSREGYVVRRADGFSDLDFERAVCKWVRAGHVTTDEHWRSQAIVRNGLDLGSHEKEDEAR